MYSALTLSFYVTQSLCHFLHHELSEYHRLLAVLEAQLSLSAPAADGLSEQESSVAKPAEGAGLTLLRLGLWTEDMRLRLRLMAMVVNDAESELIGINESNTKPRLMYSP